MTGKAPLPKDAEHRVAIDNMRYIAGGVFAMGSDRHYPEEAPVRRVEAGPFWIDETPVTNRQFAAFVRATGHKTLAEIAPDPKDYPGALPELLYAGSLVFSPMPGTPGMLSAVSPMSAFMSMTWDGVMPYFSSTAFGVISDMEEIPFCVR